MSGHGHVIPNKDGALARCGGPRLCTKCAAELDTAADGIAQQFHETYERLAPVHGYQTREASARPWQDVPERNKALMVATVRHLITSKIVRLT